MRRRPKANQLRPERDAAIVPVMGDVVQCDVDGQAECSSGGDTTGMQVSIQQSSHDGARSAQATAPARSALRYHRTGAGRAQHDLANILESHDGGEQRPL
jgi:hypothetical protein